MSAFALPFNSKVEELVLEVIKNVRRQEYTPEKLCQLQKILECKYFYWWIMDMKKEEYAMELFSEDFSFYNGDMLLADNAKAQVLNSKWSNKNMQTMHMGHQPMIWLIDDSHARGVFQYEDHMVYFDDSEVVQGWMVYCDDFVKDKNGVWHISCLRMGYRQMDGMYRDPIPPEEWEPEKWDTPDY